MNPTFRVEAFIVPISNRKDKKNDDNIIDDVKVANKLKIVNDLPKSIDWINSEDEKDDFIINSENSDIVQSCNTNSINCLPTIKIDFADLDIDDEVEKNENENVNEEIIEEDKNKNVEVNNVEESIYDVPYSLLNVNELESKKLRERFETDEYVTMKIIPSDNIKFGKALIKTSSLMSIDERGETPENCNDEFCCHGYKNGCTAITQRPEAVTEEIFEVNWMKRLEQLRTRETIIKDKEAVLFDRERLLFKKERELRILERLVKDKLKYVELYLKRCKSQNNDINSCDVESKFSEKSKDSQSSKDIGTIEQLNTIKSSDSCYGIENNVRNSKKINSENIRDTSKSIIGSLNTKANLFNEKTLKNPPNSRSSLITCTSVQYQLPKSDTGSSYLTSKNTLTGLSGYSSLRIKKRPKITYDDLDSTLSADVGDSSFAVTSKKFDPELFKKPQAFTRSCSERRRSRIIPERLPVPSPDIVQQIEEDKLLKRISENILISHDKNTKFQHYGLIDKGTSENSEWNSDNDNNRRHSYLDLEDGKKSKKNSFKVNNNNKKINMKERPISWNEETNEWLQKKRQAYNLQTAKKISIDDIYNNKENRDSQVKINQVQKKPSKGIKFSIFR